MKHKLLVVDNRVLVGHEAFSNMVARSQPGDLWHAYQNHALDSSQLGDLVFVVTGPQRTIKEDPPASMPSGGVVPTPWAWLYVGPVDLENKTIDGIPFEVVEVVEVPPTSKKGKKKK